MTDNPAPDPDEPAESTADQPDESLDDTPGAGESPPDESFDDSPAATSNATEPNQPAGDPPAPQPTAGPNPSVTDGRSIDVRRALAYGAIALLAVFALVASFRFYVAMGNVIGTWVAPEYHSLFQAVFNLAILLFAAGGIGYQLRRMGD